MLDRFSINILTDLYPNCRKSIINNQKQQKMLMGYLFNKASSIIMAVNC